MIWIFKHPVRIKPIRTDDLELYEQLNILLSERGVILLWLSKIWSNKAYKNRYIKTIYTERRFHQIDVQFRASSVLYRT